MSRTIHKKKRHGQKVSFFFLSDSDVIQEGDLQFYAFYSRPSQEEILNKRNLNDFDETYCAGELVSQHSERVYIRLC